ncbi:hypothetical protein [Plantactinospora sp. GCM10030261]|uniref:hypothetical protein n=1 Tax=Plantactinospora sp. GCM10030261 TaxID=3273420 RepID=UPI00361CAF25
MTTALAVTGAVVAVTGTAVAEPGAVRAEAELDTVAEVGLDAVTTAAAPEFRYQVTRNATYQDVPGSTITFTATSAGDQSYLWTRNLSTGNVTSLGSGDNIGNTFAIRCRDAAGVALPGESGAYWATNLVPPGETSVTPTLRWLFVAPSAGTYTCRISISSYSTIIVNGRSVTMRIPAGAELARAVYPKSGRWTLQSADLALVGRGNTLTTLGANFAPNVAGADRIAITQDAAVTTCKQGSTITGCSGGSSGYSGSTVTTWIEAQPQTSTGAACGTVQRSSAVTRGISTAKHHLSVTNTLYLTESQLGGCAKVRVSLKLRNDAGNPVVVHAGTVGGMAATHGVAFEYV